MRCFSEKVREIRMLKNLTQAELASLVCVSMRTIVSYETTDAKPHDSTLKKLAKALQVSAEYLKNDEIDDPLYGIEKEPYIDEAKELFGSRAAEEINFLMERNTALFSGGDVCDEAKEAYFQAIMRAYLDYKEKENHEK